MQRARTRIAGQQAEPDQPDSHIGEPLGERTRVGKDRGPGLETGERLGAELDLAAGLECQPAAARKVDRLRGRLEQIKGDGAVGGVDADGVPLDLDAEPSR